MSRPGELFERVYGARYSGGMSYATRDQQWTEDELKEWSSTAPRPWLEPWPDDDWTPGPEETVTPTAEERSRERG